MTTRRESILNRLSELFADIPGVRSFRNRVDVPEHLRPAVVLVDGTDEQAGQVIAPRGGEDSPLLVNMTPAIYILANSGTDLNAVRVRVIKAVMQDPELNELTKDGEISYKGFQTAFASGRSIEGEARVLFQFIYIEPRPAEAVSSEPASSEVESSAPSSELLSSAVSSEPASSVESSAPSSEYTSSDELLEDASSSEAASSDRTLSDALQSDRDQSDRDLSDDILSEQISSDQAASDARDSDEFLSEQISSDREFAEAQSSDEALSSDQASDIHAFEQASSSDYWADLRPYFINAGVATQSEGSMTATPALPSIRDDGTLLIAFLGIANFHSIGVSAGWELFMLEPTGADNEGAIAYRVIDGSETAPTFSWGGSSTANTAFVTQWGHSATIKPIGVTDQTDAFGQLGNQSLSLTNGRALSRIVAFSNSIASFDYGTPTGWERDKASPPAGGLSTPALLVDSLGADVGTYTQVGVTGGTESHLSLFELLGPYNEAQSSDRDLSDAHLSDEVDSDKHLSDAMLSDAMQSDRDLSDAMQSDRDLSDDMLSERISSDRELAEALSSERASSDHELFEQLSSDIYPRYISAGTATASTAASSRTPVSPAAVSGDLLISMVMVANSKAAINVSGTGWTAGGTLVGGLFRWAWRIHNGTDTNCSFSWTSNSACRAITLRLANSDSSPIGTINSLSVAGGNWNPGTTQSTRDHSLFLYILGSSQANGTYSPSAGWEEKGESTGASVPSLSWGIERERDSEGFTDSLTVTCTTAFCNGAVVEIKGLGL